MKPRLTTETRLTPDPAEVRAFAREMAGAPELRITQGVKRGPFRAEQLERHADQRGRVMLVNGIPCTLVAVDGQICLVQDGRQRRTVLADQIAVLCGDPPIVGGAA